MVKKIEGISLPPKKPNDMSEVFSIYHLVNPQVHGFDSKGNYLHWHDFQFRSKEFQGSDKIFAWHALKLKRALSYIPLADEKNVPFCISSTSLDAKLYRIGKEVTFEHLHLSERERKVHLAKGVIMEEAISSAQLEGAATTRKVAKEMLETQREPRDMSERMIVNNWRLIEMADDFKDAELTPEMIMEFNRVATDGVLENDHIAGQFRNDDVLVRNVATNEIIHEAPAPTKVMMLINELCNFANKDHSTGAEFVNPIVKACILHFMIGYIHPFMDGNGRTARALFYWFMLKHGYENFKYISISALLKNAPKKYVKSYICTETDENDLTHFVDYQLTVILLAMERFGRYITGKLDETREALELLDRSPLKKGLQLQHITILRKALQNPGRTFWVKEIQSDFSVSHTSARKYLDKLVDMGLLVKYKDGKENGYIAPADLKDKLRIKDV
ncbi:Fic family protein (plasmid) [Vibrio sp. SCSIO 43009]|uniref:Fic family protein n=1 Tax=Vibrio sp. SCSIO 43009 TaxID=2819103 RepID=UPI002075FA09|nr:Fic family protein [Vibrio sp. SCSIO 43009]USD77354.1 Fic family protein [Vibrio sp. SCSIO 43009]